MRNENIVVVCWGKVSDVVLIESLQNEFLNISVVIYKIPPKYWVSWLWHRVRLMGLGVLFGHLLLSAWIRFGRIADKIFRKNIWEFCGASLPSWSKIYSPVHLALSEESLQYFTSNAEMVLFTDNIRLSHRFYRSTGARILQIIWGSVPDYMGDSGGFWAYALGDRERCGPTVIQRGSQYNIFSIVGRVSLRCSKRETLRTLKVKQVLALARELGVIIEKVPLRERQTLDCRMFTAPTLFTYLHLLLKNHQLTSLPSYAYREHACVIEE